MNATAATFREPNAGQITRTLKSAGFTQAVRSGADGFRTERGSLNLAGVSAPYVIVRVVRLHSVRALRSVLGGEAGRAAFALAGVDATAADGVFPAEALRPVLGPDVDAFDAERAAEVLRARGYDAGVIVDGNDRGAVAVWSQAARDARDAFSERSARADAIAAEWIAEGAWSVEFDEFPSHSRTVRSGGHEGVRAVVAHVLRSPGSYRDMCPHWFEGMSAASVVLWVSVPGHPRGTLRITPAAMGA